MRESSRNPLPFVFFYAIWMGLASPSPAQKHNVVQPEVNVSQVQRSMQRAVTHDGLYIPSLPFFLTPVTYGPGSVDSSSVAVADLNHDGFLDVVVANKNGLSVLLGNGDGTLRTAVEYNSGQLYSYDASVVDVNGDGKPDIVLMDECGDSDCNDPTVSVFLGNGDGTFKPALTSEPVTSAEFVVVSDVNGDGKPDLMVSTQGGVSVSLGNGDGTFQPGVLYESGVYWSVGVTVADLNGDNKMDIILANQCTEYCPTWEGEGSVSILLGNGDGTFQPAATYDVAAFYAGTVVAIDVNGDRKQDLVVTTCLPNNCSWGSASVLLGKGDGTFQPAVTYAIAYVGTYSGLAVADINEDGKLDVVVPGYVLLGNGDGTFQAAQNTESNEDFGIAVADLNRDGRPDLVAANFTAGVDVQLHVGDTVTTTALTSSLNPSVFGQGNFTATVSSSSGVVTGTVILYDELLQNSFGSATLAGGSATFPAQGVPAGTNPVVVAYQGSVKYHPSLSPVVEQVVTQATTSTSVTSSVNPVKVGSPVTYTVNVTSQYGGFVSGGATCLDNGSILYPVYMHPWQFKKKYTSVGTHTIACTYAGDDNNLGSTAPILTEQALYPTTTVLASSGSPSQVGQPVTFTATVNSKFGAIPDGEIVTFSYGKKVLGTALLSNGVAVLTTSAVPKGTHTVIDTYAGDGTFETSHGKVIQVVTP
jgi:hypothetical protein